MEQKGEYIPNKLLEGLYTEAMEDEGMLDSISPCLNELLSISQRYVNEELIGQGSLKSVYKCYDQKSQRWVALAKLRSHLEEEYYDFFIHEAWLTGALNHPNIIEVYEVDVGEGGAPYFTMSLKGNQTLKDLVSEGVEDRFSLLEIFMKICDAMSYAHAQGVLHLDLKPANIQCSDYGEVLVCDWGLGKRVAGSQPSVPDLNSALLVAEQQTLYGEIKGTPGYMSPEQFNPDVQADHRSDIFSLGCLLHFILSAESLFRGSLEERREKTLGVNHSSFIKSGISKSLRAVIAKSIAVDPSERYQSVADLKEDVVRYIKGYTTKAEKPKFRREITKFVLRNKKPISILTTVMAVIAILGFYGGRKVDGLYSLLETSSEEQEQAGVELSYLYEKYANINDKNTVNKSNLAKRFLDAEARSGNSFFAQNPVKSNKLSKKLVQKAYELNDGVATRLSLFRVYCYELNFSEALKYTSGLDSKFHTDFRAVAQNFAHFDFNETKRPPVSALIDVIEFVEKEDLKVSIFLQKMILYDNSLRADKSDYPELLHLVLKNMKSSDMMFSYKHKTKALSIVSKSPVTWYYLKVGSLFAPMNLQRLNLSTVQSLDLMCLNGATIQHVDLRGTDVFLDKGKTLRIYGLKKIYFKKGSFDRTRVRDVLKSDTPYEIEFE